MAKEDSRHFAPAIHLGYACQAQPVMNGYFMQAKSTTMRTCYKLPPESFLHRSQFMCQLKCHSLRHENERSLDRARGPERLIGKKMIENANMLYESMCQRD